VHFRDDVEKYNTLLDGHVIEFKRKVSSEEPWSDYVIDGQVKIIEKKEVRSGELFLCRRSDLLLGG
jgi:hypothetical protein